MNIPLALQYLALSKNIGIRGNGESAKVTQGPPMENCISVASSKGSNKGKEVAAFVAAKGCKQDVERFP